MLYLFGLLVALASIVGSVFHLKQTLVTYLDFVAIAVVFGGTVAVSLIVLPWNYRNDIFSAIGKLLSFQGRRFNALAKECMTFIWNQSSGQNTPILFKGLAGDVLRDGAELISLGIPAEKIEIILFERIHQRTSTFHTIAQSFRSLAKYPPAFGLVGTVLGLVSLMRSVADGSPSQEIGIRMAVALVATLYGLLLANLIINPAGESIQRAAVEEKKEAEVALQAVLLSAEKVTLLVAQELLNSYLPAQDRINMISSLAESQAAFTPPPTDSAPPNEMENAA